MKKEVKSSVSPSPGQAQAKASLVKEEPGAGAGAGASPPSIKADPDAPLVNGENTIVNNSSNNNCDNSTPGTPASGAGVGGGPGDLPGGGGGPGSERDATTPSSVEDKKPVIGGSGPPSNCATGNGLIKSETDFLDTFDSKDGGKCQHLFFSFTIFHTSQRAWQHLTFLLNSNRYRTEGFSRCFAYLNADFALHYITLHYTCSRNVKMHNFPESRLPTVVLNSGNCKLVLFLVGDIAARSSPDLGPGHCPVLNIDIDTALIYTFSLNVSK